MFSAIIFPFNGRHLTRFGVKKVKKSRTEFKNVKRKNWGSRRCIIIRVFFSRVFERELALVLPPSNSDSNLPLFFF